MHANFENFLTFPVTLGWEAHKRAEARRQYQIDDRAGKQTYLNVLATYAVNFYLQCMGFETDWSEGDRDNSILYALVDTADLEVKGCGKLECRFVLAHEPACHVPPEVWEDRIGYVFVRLDAALEEATLLGFVSDVRTSKIPFDRLQSLDELPLHLHRRARQPVRLSHWLKGIFEGGWQAIAEFAKTSEPRLAFRWIGDSVRAERRVDFIDRSIQLIAEISPIDKEEFDIAVGILPGDSENSLPDFLQIALLDEHKTRLSETTAKDENRDITLELSGAFGDRFSIEITLNDESFIESFVI